MMHLVVGSHLVLQMIICHLASSFLALFLRHLSILVQLVQGFDLILCELTRVQTMVFFKEKAQQN